MAGAFVWFSLGTEDPAAARGVYASLLEWEIADPAAAAVAPWEPSP